MYQGYTFLAVDVDEAVRTRRTPKVYGAEPGEKATLDELWSVGGDRGESLSLGDTIADGNDGPVAAYEVEEMRHILADAINRMPEREKIVLTLYYYEGLTLAEIGQVLGVTESRVCQIHTKAVLQLRSKLAEPERELA